MVDASGESDPRREEVPDERALQSLLIEHLPALEAYIRLQAGGLVRRKESLSDLVQSVCVEVLRDAGQFEYRGDAPFRAWLCQQALHKIVNKNVFYSRQRRDAAREVDVVSPAAGDDSGSQQLSQVYATVCTPSRVAAGREQVEQFERAFDALPEDYREAIALHKVLGLSHREIAERLGRSEGAVRNLVYRGLAKLAEQLGD
ncbi:MAG: sigma-70 family RNA polymerase sigma factor [Planctomycetes bacterium]|nr:sigma-70 family RNA polymerase sigma factor [Planctomycetota bacterium]